ncbi:MAG: TetR/AcrR family transcriptional regulator [Gracilibacteraceae bacterium]|jgi:AcrR family transcriptional regulator|nr:TetR/AcrR family transcriptional regulator [Gracilibacteraceae bacterium]
MPRITKPVEERRQEIIDTARRLFVANGFEKTQVADISKSMNVAHGLIYHYFKSKTDILFAVIDEMVIEETEDIRQSLYSNPGSALDGLKQLLLNSRRYDRMIPQIMSNTAVKEYCENKMTVSALPQLLSLIERGNIDGSWHCEYPRETAIFILRGMSGVISSLPPSGLEVFLNHEFGKIIFRILGVESLPP